MKTKRKRLLFLVVLSIAAGLASAPPTMQAQEAAKQYSLSPDGEECGGSCSPRTLCCEIVIVPPTTGT